jgi:hypothetical protein
LLERATIPPVVPETVAVQVLDAFELSDDGVQLKPEMVGTTTDVTVPPAPVRANAFPSGEAAIVSATPSETVLPAEGASATLTTATTPF